MYRSVNLRGNRVSSRCQGCRDGAGFPLEIQTAFHPIVDLDSGEVYAYEALVRGPGGEGAGDILAQVTELNRYAFDQACRVAAIRNAVKAGLLDTGARLSINFLPNAVYSPLACIQLTLRIARETGLPIERLIFEFTENQKVDPNHVRSIIDAYRELGFTVALDDFGAGYAGLGLLANFQTDLVKLDIEIIRGIDCSVPRRQIVTAITRLCAEMGIGVIAEGVETLAELEAVRAIGIRYAQGFVFCQPQIGVLPSGRLSDGRLAIAA